ncbi:MAG TPA: amylo-alpha-1,6-glucosidase, partial [Prolixibacteraceae bacterium]|nr:amylo-alpha-1,6-glucosidase [Prolixibacteraceae bacterium]
LAVRRYQGGVFDPKGHKYMKQMEFNRIPEITYQVGSAILTKEMLLVDDARQIIIKYTIEDCTLPVKLRLKPFLAFRNIHQLSKANMFVNRKFTKVANGISMQLYENLPHLFMQFSRKTEFIPVPDWYYNIEYIKEKNRGYECLEDLFVPGYFEVTLKKDESIWFSASTEETKPVDLKKIFTTEKNNRSVRNSFLESLDHAASQFVMRTTTGTDIIAGFPWYDSITRQTFVSLPGLCLSLNDSATCSDVIDTYLKHLKNGFFPDQINQKIPVYQSADAPLWFIWALSKYYKKHHKPKEFWAKYGNAITEILQAYKSSALKYVGTTREGLVFAKLANTPLTWMNSTVDGVPVVQRDGMPVEINALWYNAITFAVELAHAAGESTFADTWKVTLKKTGDVFVKTFWNPGHNHLADVIKEGRADWSVRPNMVIALAMEHSPLSAAQQKSALDVITKDLLTKRGLRTLAPEHIRFKSSVEGNHNERESAVHQGAVWPWLIQFYVEAYLKIHRKSGVQAMRNLLAGFEDDIIEHCIGTLSEMYNGAPPHKAKGAISQAWSVAAVLYANHLVQSYSE